MTFSSRSFRCRWLPLLGFVGGIYIFPTFAHAQTVDPQQATAAQALFEQAVTEMDAGKYASACKKLEEVTRLVPEGVGGKLALGECYQRVGRLASAWSQYSFAQQIAARLGQTERADLAQSKANALKPKLATLTVNVPESLANVTGIAVVRDGLELREAQWGTSLYVDAGQHKIVVSAPDYTKWEKNIEVLADGVKVNFAVPENAITPVPAAGKNASVPAGPAMVSPANRSWQKPVGMVSLAVGGSSIAVGGLFGAFAMAYYKAINASGACDAVQNECNAVGYEARGQALNLGNVATGLLVAGALIGVGGIVLWSTAPPETPKRETDNGPKKAEITLGPASVVFRGSF